MQAFDPAPLARAFSKARNTGLTCGSGASDYSHSFAARIVTTLENDLKAKVHGPNICFGGALSVTQLALIKQEGLKWSPELIVLEARTLDAFSPDQSLPAIESIFRLAIARNILIIAIHPYPSYAAGPKKELMELAALYRIFIVDMSEVAASKGLKLTDLSSDYVHPNDRGHALISDAVHDRFAAARERIFKEPGKQQAPHHLRVRVEIGAVIDGILVSE